jgi:glycosyltransferase involved in cell wall biosynthesis
VSPKVSICIPAYKQPNHLKRVLLSIQAQTYNDYEIIITDDTPNDSVEKVVCVFQQNSKLKYYRNKEPKGSPENWNEAINLASGEYIKILHHDDWFSETHSLLKFVKMMDENRDADFGYSSTYACDADQRVKYLHQATQNQLDKLKTNPLVLFAGNFIGSPSNTIYRRKSGVTFDAKLKWVVDIDFYIRVLKTNPNFIYYPEPLIFTTAEAPHQVTLKCSDNRDVELFEWLYLYKKICTLYGLNYNMIAVIIHLIKKYNVQSISELIAIGIEPPIPLSIEAVIHIQSISTLVRKRVLSR